MDSMCNYSKVTRNLIVPPFGGDPAPDSSINCHLNQQSIDLDEPLIA